MSKEMISAMFSACLVLKRNIASSGFCASNSSVVFIVVVSLCMMAEILNIMEVLEVGHGCFVSGVVGVGFRVAR